jgi:CDP-diglyceride synthetase
VRHLKRKIVSRRGMRLPSLEWLQWANFRAIIVSVLMLGVGILSGLVLNQINAQEKSLRLKWNDPVVLSTWLMFFWLLAAVVLGAVYRPARQGRRVAYLTLASFVFLAIMLATGLLVQSRHWGRGERRRAQAEEGTAECQVRSTEYGAPVASFLVPTLCVGAKVRTPYSVLMLPRSPFRPVPDGGPPC